MIHSKRVKYLSAKVIAQFDARSAAEWRSMKGIRFLFYRNCDGIWVIRQNGVPLCVIGLRLNSMIAGGMEVFFLLCKAAAWNLKSLIRWLKSAFRHAVRIFGIITTTIEESFTIGQRFIKFFGFVPVTQPIVASGIQYRLYELRAPWLS